MRVLYVTTISLTMNSFFKPHIEMLVREGNQVDIACNLEGLPLDELYSELGCNSYQIDFSRLPFSRENIKAYGQLKEVIANGNYDIVHCHTPNASAIARLVCRKFRKKDGLKVFYTAHGFHFYKGAPLKNWLLFYSIEKLCSKWTDVLITINQEDYTLAKKKMKTKRVEYVPGVGIELSRFENLEVDKAAKRREIGVPEEAFLLLSVGELNVNKNHQVVIKAISKLGDPNIHYAIAGEGEKKDYLLQLANEYGVSQQVHLLGYRKDVPQLNRSADAFCLPSYREGLSVSLMEAMACRMPCIASRIRGNIDLVDENGGAVFERSSEDECLLAITSVMKRNRQDMGKYNGKKIEKFGYSIVSEKIRRLYFGNV